MSWSKNIGTQSSLRSALKDTWNLLRRAAECQVGYFFYDGIGVEKDADKAFYWTQRAAEHGDRDGQFNLAYFYEEGIGTPVNMEKAKHWYKKAAEQNHDLAIQKCQDLNLGDE